MNILHIKSYNIKYNTIQQYHSYLNISLLIIIGVLLSMAALSSISAVENTTKKIDTNPLSELAPKPENTTKK